MPRLSIIVPYQGDSGPFEDSLISVLQNRPSHCEVIVPHPVGYRDPYHLDDEVIFVAVAGRPSLVALLNAGLEHASGKVLFVMQNGVEAHEGWSDAPLAHFEHADVGSVAPRLLNKSNRDRLVALGVGYGAGGKRRLIGRGARSNAAKVLGPSLAAGFYRTSALRSLGGFDPAVGDELADVNVALSLQWVGYRCVSEPRSCADSSGEPPTKRWSVETGRQAERLYSRYATHFEPGRARIAHAVHLGGEAVRGIARPLQWVAHWTGRALALCEYSKRRRFHQHLQGQPRPDTQTTIPAGAILPMRPTSVAAGEVLHGKWAA